MKKAEKYFRIGVEKESCASKKRQRGLEEEIIRIIVELACTKNQKKEESVLTLEILPDKLSNKTKLEWT